ncbi:Phosphoribosyl-AMP cyclohydrolase [Hoeflea phototrophica DFL-43]|jgi:phosphoribosyl-AMP cyclohydrolase|uniref:Phosphoribosyl-AMP cyclohydrolase n=1 Tax=Hoeflea phototrophica (strain DSM 17068 / NCIMB 14078 / DFL-43) TaxID=411684 RepID=A9D9T4_HOEPD|nr:phosphoribosyl-AMP cyclohydrolase [Hoeflea phototrophica]EDQ32982.1 Phosphoribosyl-AMP cyclohydrolase [Hoeflea phototrophica DFL-43]
MTTFFEAPSSDKAVLEEGTVLSPRFDSAGLVTAVVADATDNEILMLAYMNAQALQLTIETGIAHYWSRSRNSLWKKGETSGNLQMVEDIRVDCDQDAVLLKVRVAGKDATCHTGRRSCFYRKVDLQNGKPGLLTMAEPLFDPGTVYGKK